MNPRLRIALAVIVLIIIVAIGWWAWRPRADDADRLTGYVEADTLYLSAPAAGTVTQLFVTRGQTVRAGAPLFAMDPATLSAVQGQAEARLAQSRALIGSAAARADQARASVAAARAQEVEARRTLARHLGLQRTNPAAVAAREIDDARAAADSATAQRVAAERAAAALTQDVGAARTGAVQAQAAVAEQRARLGQLSQTAPASGRIEDVFFQAGEWAGASQPVVALLPDGRVKLRFYVPQASLVLYRPGRVVRFSCDGCGDAMTATITFVSPRSEFTPPVIYSRKSRDRMVFMVEARPARPGALTPGLPVDVEPLATLGGKDARR